MSKSAPVTHSFTVNGVTFTGVERLASAKSENAGRPFLVLEDKAVDAPTLLKMFTALGVVPCTTLAVKSLNKHIGPATIDAFVETTDAEGKKTYKYDAGKAAALAQEAIADAVSADKSQLEETIAAKRAEKDDIVNKEILPYVAKGQPITNPAVIQRVQTLGLDIAKLEARLAKRSRPKKADKEEAAK